MYPNDPSEQYAYIYDVNNDNDFNQQHYPQQQYAEDCGSDWHWPSFNYEAANPQPFHHAFKQESLQNSETGEGEDTREGLMLEEDDEDIIYNDGLEQRHEEESVEVHIEEARLVGPGTKEICRATINSRHVSANRTAMSMVT